MYNVNAKTYINLSISVWTCTLCATNAITHAAKFVGMYTMER